uniref:Uncharacterized protein n=1 Tax=Anguilla anguilla TaxID=7936 RepID=A0A0E9UZ27_ANGAN
MRVLDHYKQNTTRTHRLLYSVKLCSAQNQSINVIPPTSHPLL